jgi:RNA polymerase sigma-B factor
MARDARPNITGGRRDEQLLRQYACDRNPHVRAQLVERYLPLARYAASRYARGPEPFDDLLQIASLGLLKAIDRFDPSRGAAFSSYALPTMSGELRRHFRDRGWAVRPPRELQEQALVVEHAIEALSRDLGRAPTVSEIAERAGFDEETVLEAREALTARHATSLSAPVGGEERDDRLEDHLGDADDGFARAEERATLSHLTRALTRREREVIRLRFEEDLTQEQIGRAVGLSQMQVSRIIRAAIDKLRLAAAEAERAAAVSAGSERPPRALGAAGGRLSRRR